MEAINAEQFATLVDYFSHYAGYLIVMLYPEDTTVLDDDYERVTEI